MSTDDAPIDVPVLLSLARELAEQIAKRYRIDAESAYSSILAGWRTNRTLMERAALEPDAQRLKRTRAYKNAADKVKSTTYQNLRKYQQSAEQMNQAVTALREVASSGADANDPRAIAARDTIAASHLSTRERLPDLDAFTTALFDLAPDPSSILDIGCGMQPLLFPFDGVGSITSHYLGLDRDHSVIEAVDAWGRNVGGKRLQARRWSLSDGFSDVVGPESDGTFSLALALKLIPVLARQERKRLALFQDLPATRLLVTGAREAMVKRHSIERRERASLLAFADQLGFEVIETFDTPSEIGLLLDTQ